MSRMMDVCFEQGQYARLAFCRPTSDLLCKAHGGDLNVDGEVGGLGVGSSVDGHSVRDQERRALGPEAEPVTRCRDILSTSGWRG